MSQKVYIKLTLGDIIASLPEDPTLRRNALYRAVRTIVSDMQPFCEVLATVAEEYQHITEFGTRQGISTVAFLYSQPRVLHTYDIERLPDIDIIESVAGDTEFHFHLEDTLTATIEETDVLFIDTLHTYQQLYAELLRHAEKVRSLILLHDTVAFGQVGEDGGEGLVKAIYDFQQHDLGKKFDVLYHYETEPGFTCLKRML